MLYVIMHIGLHTEAHPKHDCIGIAKTDECF
jgi:hypothetical protein